MDQSLQTDDVCCLCLDKPELCTAMTLSCCKHVLHQKCLFLLIINGYKHCPLCRKEFNPYIYFNEDSVGVHYEMLTDDEKELYHHSVNELLFNMSKKPHALYGYNVVTLPSLRRTTRYFWSSFIRNKSLVIIILMYTLLHNVLLIMCY